MSNSPLSLDPGRLLRRAGGLSSSNGQVVKELADSNNNTSIGTPLRRNGLGASIKRKFQDFKDRSRMLGRSKSVNDAARSASLDNPHNVKQRKGHSRSLSDVTSSRPDIPPHSYSAPSPNSKRHSALPMLSSVLEGVAVQHVSSPVAEAMIDSEASSPAIGNIRVPQLLQQGTPMTKVSVKKHTKCVFRLDADLGQIVWESKRHRIIPIESIKEIRSGDDAAYYRHQLHLSQDYQDRWLTIIYIIDGQWKTLHLIPATKDVFRMWDKTLRELHAIRQELMRGLGNIEMRQALWEKQYWKGADEERDQKLSFDEVDKLCKRLNINSSREDLQRLFMQADVQGRQFLDFEDFRRFVKLLKGRPEIDRLYKKLRVTNNGVFDFGVFERFMRLKQKSPLSQDELLVLFVKYSPTAPVMTMDNFTSFLLSPDNSAFADQHRDIWHDMTRPLPEYFISSSHNTYLVGHQLVGDSTIEGYIRALLQSCRSVELDIYDGEQEPMIFHGKTFTSKVSVREVCAAIAKYGFAASPYPIIISAEVHCSVSQQDMIAQIMIEVFGDRLVKTPPEGVGKIEELPSPEELKGKIMLKTKNLELLRSDSSESDGEYITDPSSSASESEAYFDAVGPSSPTPKHRRRPSDNMKDQISKVRSNILQRVRSVGRGSAVTPELIVSQTTPPGVLLQSPLPLSPPPSAALKSPGLTPRRPSEPIVDGQRPKPKMSMALVALLVYTVGVKCRGINKKEEYAPEHMFSLSETAAHKMLRFNMWDLMKHTKTHLVRTYPKGTRLSSTNYEPHRFWAAGMQLVAINWQTFDLGYMINHAMFQRNGRSGYVLKPKAIRLAQKDLLAKRTMHTFVVTIISAQQLPPPRDASGREVADKAIVDPYVEVTLYVPEWPVQPETRLKNKAKARSKSRDREGLKDNGVLNAPAMSSTPSRSSNGTTSTPSRTISAKTSVVKKNGFNPVWEEKLMIPFDCVGDMMDLIFVRFVVKQEDKDTDEPLAVYCASLGSLQHGYRHLPLHDSQLSQYLYSTLFVRLNVFDDVPPP